MIVRGTARYQGFTVVEMMVVVAIIAVLAGLALPIVRSAKKTGNEAATIGSLHTLTSAQETHRSRSGGYGDLAQLVSEGLVDDTYLLAPRHGYSTQTAGVSVGTWSASSAPSQPGQTGDRYFYVDESAVIRSNASGAASATDPVID